MRCAGEIRHSHVSHRTRFGVRQEKSRKPLRAFKRFFAHSIFQSRAQLKVLKLLGTEQDSACGPGPLTAAVAASVMSDRSEEHTSELQSLMRISYAVFCLQKKNTKYTD